MEQSTTLILTVSILGPVIGSLLGVLKNPSQRFMHNMLSFAGGVMLSISFLQLIPESIELSSTEVAAAGILSGALTMFAVDKLIPHIHPGLCAQEHGRNLKKTATYIFIGIFIHNFPEGMAIAVGSVSGEHLSILIATAIAIHNIPEGICTSAPYYYTSRKRLKSFLISSTTAIPIIAGFLFASMIYPQITQTHIGFMIGATAGLMIYITSDEIIPCSCAKNSNHTTIFSLIAGILFVMLLDYI